MPYLNKSDFKTVDNQYKKLSRLRNSTFTNTNPEYIHRKNKELNR